MKVKQRRVLLVIGMVVATICFSIYTASEWKQNVTNGSSDTSLTEKILP